MLALEAVMEVPLAAAVAQVWPLWSTRIVECDINAWLNMLMHGFATLEAQTDLGTTQSRAEDFQSKFLLEAPTDHERASTPASNKANLDCGTKMKMNKQKTNGEN